MRSFTLWETPRRKTRWTLYVGKCGKGRHAHWLRLDKLHVSSGKSHRRMLPLHRQVRSQTDESKTERIERMRRDGLDETRARVEREEES